MTYYLSPETLNLFARLALSPAVTSMTLSN